MMRRTMHRPRALDVGVQTPEQHKQPALLFFVQAQAIVGHFKW